MEKKFIKEDFHESEKMICPNCKKEKELGGLDKIYCCGITILSYSACYDPYAQISHEG